MNLLPLVIKEVNKQYTKTAKPSVKKSLINFSWGIGRSIRVIAREKIVIPIFTVLALFPYVNLYFARSIPNGKENP